MVFFRRGIGGVGCGCSGGITGRVAVEILGGFLVVVWRAAIV